MGIIRITQKKVNNSLILLRLSGTGAINQSAAGLKATPSRKDKLLLHASNALNHDRIPHTNSLRALTNSACSATRRIKQDPVKLNIRISKTLAGHQRNNLIKDTHALKINAESGKTVPLNIISNKTT